MTRQGTILATLTLGVAISLVASTKGGAQTAPQEPAKPSPLSPISNDAMMLGNDYAALAAVLGADNGQPGPRTVPGRVIPVPTTVSPQFETQVAAPYRAPAWNADPQSKEAWHALVAKLAAQGAARLPALREKLGVTSEPTTLGGVGAFPRQGPRPSLRRMSAR